MICTVTNQTGGTITFPSVSHLWQGVTNALTHRPASLADGESVSFTINVGAGGSDEWSVRFTDAQGNCWYRDSKQCDINEDDLKSGLPVKINLLNGSQGFSIEPPVSSSCVDNSYDSCS